MNANWPSVSLGDLIRLERRPVELKPEQQYQEIGIYCFGRGIFHKTPRSGLEVGDKNLYELREGDLILQVTFAWEGAIALCSKAEHGLYGSTRYPTFHVDETRCFAPFLVRYLGTRHGLDQINKICPGSAGRNRVLSLKRIPEVMVPLPALPEQRRILARIEELAAKINEARKIRTYIEKEQDLLLASAFHRIAANAPRQPLGEIAPLTRRAVPIDPEKEYPQIAVRSFGKGTFHKPPLAGSDVTWQKPFLVKADDILISNIKAWEGAIAVAANGDDGRVGSHRYLTFVPRPSVATARFVCFYLLTAEGLHHVGEASPGSADRNRTLSSKALLQIPIPVPSFEQQIWFDRLYKKVDALKKLQAKAGLKLDALLPSILDRAFKGDF
jgi:type I restriction enzyme S subunit